MVGRTGAVRAYVLVLGALGALTLVLAAASASESEAGNGWVLVGFAAAMTVIQAFPILLVKGDEAESLQLEEAFLVAMSLLLPPGTTVLVMAIAVGTGHLLRRRRLQKAVFNIGQVATSAGLAEVVIHRLAPSGATGVGGALAAIAGAAVFFVLNTSAVSIVLSLAEGKPVRATFLGGLDLRLVVWGGSVTAGALVGLAAERSLWSLPFGALALVLLSLSFLGVAKIRGGRERVRSLLTAAMAAHESMGVSDVERNIVASACQLLSCKTGRIGPHRPGAGELGARLPVMGDPVWLVVSDRRGPEPFDDVDVTLLETLAAVVTAALDNARL